MTKTSLYYVLLLCNDIIFSVGGIQTRQGRYHHFIFGQTQSGHFLHQQNIGNGMIYYGQILINAKYVIGEL